MRYTARDVRFLLDNNDGTFTLKLNTGVKRKITAQEASEIKAHLDKELGVAAGIPQPNKTGLELK
jgi:hypothetical protein